MPTSGLCRPAPKVAARDGFGGRKGRHNPAPTPGALDNGAREHQVSQRRAFCTAQCVEHPGRPCVAMLVDSGASPTLDRTTRTTTRAF
jgi:hypothetical protein